MLNDLTADHVRSILDYDPETGFLTWKHTKSGRSNGAVAGTAGQWGNFGKKRMTITINGKIYKYHRIIWLWMTGKWPDGIIDHDDRNSMNNCWRNLKDTTYKGNSNNQDRHRNNTSGMTGVCWDRTQRRWRVDFRGKFVGSFRKKEGAIAARERVVSMLAGEFAPKLIEEWPHTGSLPTEDKQRRRTSEDQY